MLTLLAALTGLLIKLDPSLINYLTAFETKELPLFITDSLLDYILPNTYCHAPPVQIVLIEHATHAVLQQLYTSFVSFIYAPHWLPLHSAATRILPNGI